MGDVLANRVSHDLLKAVDEEFRRAEVEAGHLAEPNPHALEFMRAALAAGKAIAIVSNNSEEAIRAYLQQHARDLDVPIFGRPFAAPQLMKSHPFVVQAALDTLNISAAETVLIGDSLTDVQVSNAFGVRCIGLADTEAKR